jgi:hypothetical protein
MCGFGGPAYVDHDVHLSDCWNAKTSYDADKYTFTHTTMQVWHQVCPGTDSC